MSRTGRFAGWLLPGLVLAGLIQIGCGGGADSGNADNGSKGQTIDPAQYLTIETGTLPIVLSAPHGGEKDIPGVAERTTGTTDLDTNTYELTTAIQSQLSALTGGKAYLVAALASRKYVDFNRSSAEAYENPAVAPLYQAYHAALQNAVAAAKTRSAIGALLIDVHGQSADVTVVFRGTRSGQTAHLASLYATSPDDLITTLLGDGITVSPSTAGGAENPDFNGGYIVGTYGLAGSGGINAVQLEFGYDYRATPTALSDTAAKVVDALVAHLQANPPGTL